MTQLFILEYFRDVMIKTPLFHRPFFTRIHCSGLLGALFTSLVLLLALTPELFLKNRAVPVLFLPMHD